MDNIGLKKKYSSLKMDNITVIKLKTLAKQRGIKYYYKLRTAELIQKFEAYPDVNEQVLIPVLEIPRHTTRSVNISAILDDPILDDKTSVLQPTPNFIAKSIQNIKDFGNWLLDYIPPKPKGDTFHSKTEVDLESADSNELFSKMKETVLESLARFQRQGSKWRFHSILSLDLDTVKYELLGDSIYIPLPGFLAAKKAIINLKNEDEECFKWAITRALIPVEKNSERIDIKLREKSEVLNWESLKFPVNLSDINKFENHNSSSSVNIFVTKFWFILLE